MLRYTAFFLSALILTVSCNTSCASSEGKKEASGPAAAVETTTHKGVGTVKALKPAVPSVEIDHEDIPGLMPAMEMEFRVKDKSLLDNLEVGNRVEFTIENGVGGLMIVSIKRV